MYLFVRILLNNKLKMQFIFVTLLLISSFWLVESSSTWLSIYKALFNRQRAKDCVPLTNDYCPIVNVVHGIFPSGGNNIDWNMILNTIPDDESLEWIILLGLQQFVLFAMDNPETQPNDFDSLVQELVRIANILATHGSANIQWKDLKPLLQRFMFSVFPQ
jgi:hypothetical protein